MAGADDFRIAGIKRQRQAVMLDGLVPAGCVLAFAAGGNVAPGQFFRVLAQAEIVDGLRQV